MFFQAGTGISDIIHLCFAACQRLTHTRARDLYPVPGVGAQGSCSPCCHAAAQLLLTWNCCGCWRGLKRWLHAVVTHPCFDLGIVLCLILNIIFSAMEHFPLTAQLAQTLTTAELVGIGGGGGIAVVTSPTNLMSLACLRSSRSSLSQRCW